MNAPDLDRIARELADQGRLVEAGWIGFSILAQQPGVPCEVMRDAYMAGAYHVFRSMISTLDEGSEPTDADMARMSMISAEIDAFERQLRARYGDKPWWK